MQKQTFTPTESPGLGATDKYPISAPQAADKKSDTSSTAAAKNWSPGLQHVLDQPPAAFPRHLLLGGMLFCITFIAWAWLGKIDEVGHARGQLVPKGEVYKINPVESGKVTRLTVKEGDTVKAGQFMVELDTQIAATDVDRLQQERASYRTQFSQTQGLIDKTRLEAQTVAKRSNADAQAAWVAIAQAQAKVQAQTAVIAQANEKVATNRSLLIQLQAEVNAHQARLQRLRPLVQQGAIGVEQLFQAEQALRDRQRSITESQGELQQSLTDLNRLQAEQQQVLDEPSRLQAELATKQAQATADQVQAQQKIQQLEVEKTQLQAKFNQNEKLLTKAIAELKQHSLTAPVDGVVSSLNIHHIGEVVQAGQTVAEIAPREAPLILAAKLPNPEAGFVKTGMPVQVKLDAYPYQNYGLVTGFVRSISPDAKQDKQQGEVYQVEVALNRNYVTADHQTIQFKAGQTATAEIIIRRRRIADLLLDPIKQLQKGGINL
jgi:multidrug efflux pump subunit AcrA (membrane-fusion protein)